MAERPIRAAMNFDFADLLRDVVAAPRVLTCTSPPGLRDGSAIPRPPRRRGGLSAPDADRHREIVYSILTNDQRQKLETDWQIDFAYSVPGHARFRVNAYFQRSAIGAPSA
jgi:twitching motility protein PilT